MKHIQGSNAAESHKNHKWLQQILKHMLYNHVTKCCVIYFENKQINKQNVYTLSAMVVKRSFMVHLLYSRQADTVQTIFLNRQHIFNNKTGRVSSLCLT